MKKIITTAFLTLAFACAFGQDSFTEVVLPNRVQVEVKPTVPVIEAKIAPRKSFGYVKLGVSDSRLPKDTDHVLPGVALGYRLASGMSALDFSASYNQRNTKTDLGKEKTYQYTAPKVNYLFYLTPNSNTSAYAGAGMAFGGIEIGDVQEFHGLIPNLVLGCEMGRTAAWKTFLQLDVSQAAIALTQKGDLPKPYAELALGAGF